MLLKTISTPSPLHIDLQPLSADQATEAVCQLREDFLAGKGVLPVISEERVVKLSNDYIIHRVCPETKQLGNFAGDPKLPYNTVAIVCQNTPEDMRVSPIYITSDMEAYVISDTGVTVSVINGKKDVVDLGVDNFKRSGSDISITSNGNRLTITADTISLHSDSIPSKTGPAL